MANSSQISAIKVNSSGKHKLQGDDLETSRIVKKKHRDKETLDETSEDAPLLKKTLLLTGFSREAKIPDIIDFFNDVGEVVRVRLFVDKKCNHTGSAFVEFASSNQATKALQKKNGAYWDDYRILVQLPNGATSLPPRFCLDHKVWYHEHEHKSPPIQAPLGFYLNVLFVANLSPNTTRIWQILDFFQEFRVTSVRLIVNPKSRHLGYAFVKFSSALEATTALEMKNGAYLQDHKILLMIQPYISLDSVEIDAVRKKTLFVSNLSAETRVWHLINFFKDIGQVVHVRLIVSDTGKLLGCGFVEFASVDEANMVLEKKNGEHFENGPISLEVFNTAKFRPGFMYCIDHKVCDEDYLVAVEGIDETPDFEEVAVREKTLFFQGLVQFLEGIGYISVGEVVRVRLVADECGEYIGCGYVEFASAKIADKVLAIHSGGMVHLEKVGEMSPYPFRPKYNLADLVDKLSYEDYLRYQSLCLKPKKLETKSETKAVLFSGLFSGKHNRQGDELETTRILKKKHRDKETLDETSEEASILKKTLLLTCFPPLARIPDIIDFFKDVGEVVRVQLFVSKKLNNKGSAFVEFASSNQAKKALQEKNNVYWEYFKILVDVPTSLPPRFCLDHKVWYHEHEHESPPIQEDMNVLFVANLSPNTTRIWQILDFFQEFRVTSVRLIVNPKSRHLGYAFVKFSSAHKAAMALKMKNGAYLQDHKILLMIQPYIALDSVEVDAVRKKTLFVSNLSVETRVWHLINFFKDIGQVVHVRLIVSDTGKLVGCGFVEFASVDEANMVLEKKNGQHFENAPISLEVFNTAQYPPEFEYCIHHKVWYEDYLLTGEGIDETPDFEEVAVREKTLFFQGLVRFFEGIGYIIKCFKSVGEVVRVRLIADEYGKYIGCGYVEFASAEIADKVLAIHSGGMVQLEKVGEMAPYPFRPKYKLADLVQKLSYEDYLRQQSLCLKTEELETKKSAIKSESKAVLFSGKKTRILSDEE